MKTLNYIAILIYLVTISCVAQLNPEPKKLTKTFFSEVDHVEEVTPALQKKKGFTNYEELLLFINKLTSKFPDEVTTNFIGESQNGHQIPIVYISNPNSKEEKVRVWLQGGLHGNEPASTEGVLYLMHQLLHNPEYNYLLNRLEIAIVPMANIDGYVKLNRASANGLDLNRDQTKLMAPESMVLKQAYSSFNPEVALDFHEYNAFRRDFAKMGSFGITSAFDVMFLYSSNLNVPPNLRAVIDTVFVEQARKKVGTKNLRYDDYMSTTNHFGEIHFNKGSNSARSSASSYALSNTISALIEVRGVNLRRTSFKRRINTTFLVGLSYLESSYKNVSLVKESIQHAEAVEQEIVLKTKKRVYQDTIPSIDIYANKLIELPVTFRDAKNAKALRTRPSPKAYILHKELGYLVEKIQALGIEVSRLQQEKDFLVEVFTVTSYERGAIPFEKMNLQEVETEISIANKSFPKGTYYISTQQKNKGLLYEVLEPEAPNSFISFGVLETDLNEELPIYRIPKIR